MKAAVYSKRDSEKVLAIQDVEKPLPKDNEVLVHVRAASVNPLDWRLKKQRPGVDLAGEITAIGKSVRRFKPGDTVFGGGRGAFAEYACATEQTLAIKPEYLTFEQAASMPIAAITALQGLRDVGRLQAGQEVLINGAAGGIGTFAVQIAKSFGASVTGVCSTKNVEMVRSLGADHVIDYTREDFTESGQLYDLILDNVGNRSLLAMKRVLASRGKCALAGAPKTISAAIARMLKALLWSPFSRQKFTFFIAKLKPDDLVSLCDLVRAGKLTPVIERRYALTEAADAIAYVEAGHPRAKVVITLE